MQLSVLSSLVASAGFFAAFLFVAAAAWISWRTRSTHVIANRVWRWLTDRQEVNDAKIREFVDEQNDLMSFSFVTGLNALDCEEAHRLIEEIRHARVDVTDVRLARGRIETASSGIRVKSVPHRATLVTEFLFAGLVSLMCLVSVLSMVTDSVIVKFAEGDWLVLDAARAKPLSRSGARLTPGQCVEGSMSSNFRMRPEDVANVCAA